MATQTATKPPAKSYTDTKKAVVEVENRQALTVIHKQLTIKKSIFLKLLPRGMDGDRMFAVALNAVMKNPELQECHPATIVRAIGALFSIGLEPNTELKEAYLVPMWNGKLGCKEAVAWPAYKGLMKLARMSGGIIKIEAWPVFANDKLEVRLGLNPTLDHHPVLDGDRGDMRLVYSVATLKDGEKQFAYMNMKEVEAIRARSKAADSGPWKTDYEPMSLKTVVKKLCRMLPQSLELAKAIEIDNNAETGEEVELVGIDELLDGVDADKRLEAPKTTGKIDSLKQTVAEQVGEKKEEEPFPYTAEQVAKYAKVYFEKLPKEIRQVADLEALKQEPALLRKVFAATSEVASEPIEVILEQ